MAPTITMLPRATKGLIEKQVKKRPSTFFKRNMRNVKSKFKKTQRKISGLATRAKSSLSQAKTKFTEKTPPYLEKLDNLLQGYGFKSDADVFIDAFKGDKVKNIKHLLSKHNILTPEHVNIPGLKHLKPIEIAVWSKNFNIAKYLKSQGASFDDGDYMRYKSGNKYYYLRDNALTEGIVASNTGKFNTGTSIEFFPNDLAIVNFLIENHYVSINELNKNWSTPLMLAAEYGQKELVKFLLKKGASTELNSLNLVGGNSALGLANLYGHKDIADLLLEHIQEQKIYEKQKEEFLKQKSRTIKD